MQMSFNYHQLKNLAANALVVRTSIDTMSLAAPVRNVIWSVDKDQTVADIETMNNIVAEAVARQRFSMRCWAYLRYSHCCLPPLEFMA